jgi:hypothetical protein
VPNRSILSSASVTACSFPPWSGLRSVSNPRVGVRSLLAVALLASVVLGLTPVTSTAVADGATGRVTFGPPWNMILDTRNVGDAIAAGADVHLVAGLLSVSAEPTDHGAGTADVFPCVGGAPDGEPTFRFDHDGLQTRSIVASPDVPLCLRSTVEIDVVEILRGEVAASPVVDGLQYQPLADPEVVLDAEVSPPLSNSNASTPIGRGTLTPFAAGVTFAVEAVSDDDLDDGLYVSVVVCGQGTTGPDLLIADGEYGFTVVSIALAANQQACLYTIGHGYVHVELLGELNTTGPDPTRLPPSTTSRLQSAPPPGFVPISPERAFDTRLDPLGALVAGDVLTVDLYDFLTPYSTAVVMNVTVAEAEADGFLTVWPCDEDQPNASNLNFQRGVDVPNLVTVRLALDGTVCITGSATTQVLGDIAGTYEFGDGFGSTPIVPTRIMDTRRAFGAATVDAGGTIALQVAGQPGIPASGVVAVTLNATVTAARSDGYLTVWPCDQPRPNASNLNFRRGIDVPNLVTVKLAGDGSVCLFSTARTDVIADVAMYYSGASPGGFMDLVPSRVLDTRVPIGQTTQAKLGAGSTLELRIAGSGGVPPTGAASVTMNVTVANPEAGGYLTVWPCDQPQPDASNLNFQRDVNVPNLVTVKLSVTGSICFFSTATTNVLADVAGYTSTTPVQWWAVVIAP